MSTKTIVVREHYKFRLTSATTSDGNPAAKHPKVRQLYPGFIFSVSIRLGSNRTISGGEKIHIDKITLKVYDPDHRFSGYDDPGNDGYRAVREDSVHTHAIWHDEYKLQKISDTQGIFAMDGFQFLQPGSFKIKFHAKLNGVGDEDLGTTEEEQIVKVTGQPANAGGFI
ncbi:hypothetical protein VTN77DRAFT_8061 [Rasamsonia byssochlamydoides]|uniref:uncharacterized protein n=1 Tax=Rasamsonia byssochlamydoides TaxID=89139 RepID=UPI003742A182